MDGCSLNDAFPDGAYGSPGCQDRTSGDESRKQEKKKARRCRGPAATYLNKGMNMVGSIDSDPDRPAVLQMGDVPTLNSKTGIKEHAPVTEQYDFESFVGAMNDLPSIRNSVHGTTELQSSSAPSFFGASPSDNIVQSSNGKLLEHFTNSTAPYVDTIGEDESYKLVPDFAKSFVAQGVQKAGGVPAARGPSPINQETAYLTPTSMLPNSILPFPNVDMFWKNNPKTGGQSSFFESLRPPGGLPTGSIEEPNTADQSMNRREVLTKLDKIFARLDDMDSVKSENAQTEVLLFIMTGLGVIFLMDIGCRAAASLASRR